MILMNVLHDPKHSPKRPSRGRIAPFLLAVIMMLGLGVFLSRQGSELVVRRMGNDERAMVELVLETMAYNEKLAPLVDKMTIGWDEATWWVAESSEKLVTVEKRRIIVSSKFFDLDPVHQQSAFLPLVSQSTDVLLDQSSEIAVKEKSD